MLEKSNQPKKDSRVLYRVVIGFVRPIGLVGSTGLLVFGVYLVYPVSRALRAGNLGFGASGSLRALFV